MGIDFKIRDFAYPLTICSTKAALDRSQWLSGEGLRGYQLRRLRSVLDHAHRYVPYYRDLFEKKGLHPNDITSLEDMESIPYLTKDILRTEGHRLMAENVGGNGCTWVTTSGTTGGQVRLRMDKAANALEFAYYWRLFGWMGYRIRDRFAELSAEWFDGGSKREGRFCHLDRITNRLMVNSLLISRDNAATFAPIFRRYKPKFLKGLPSNLSCLASALAKTGCLVSGLKAVFSVGENLTEHQRRLVERVFSCKVIDCYGHMERTVAISQCPHGTYHIHSDYGIAEFVHPEPHAGAGSSPGLSVREIVGTSLHNLSMPLIRYRTGDLVELADSSEQCSCGRAFPVVRSIIGRSADVVVTPDGRSITALYTALDKTPGVICGQIVQESLQEVVARVAVEPRADGVVDSQLRANIQKLVGTSMNVRVIRSAADEIRGPDRRKFKVVVSLVSHHETSPHC